MPNNSAYVSIKILYNNAKEEYNYQRERVQKLESKIELIITLISTIFTFEIANVLNVLKIDYLINSVENFNKFVSEMLKNIPCIISLVTMVVAIILSIIIIFKVKIRVVNVVDLYNTGIYKYSEDKILPYLTALYVRISDYNFRKLNFLYKLINVVVIISIVSIISFGIAYLF